MPSALGPDDLTPDAVASRSFAFVKRGYDVQEVRTFLDQAAEELRVLHAHTAELGRRLADTEDRLEAARQLDEDEVAAKLGAETIRVLDAARSAAAVTRGRADEEAAGIVRRAEATAELARVEAAEEAARRLAAADDEVAVRLQGAADALQEARARADALVEEGRTQGRAMVDEAREVRERMLRDLARRRRTLRQQIDQLQVGRDRLLVAFAAVGEVIEEATRELEVALPEARAAAEEVEGDADTDDLDADVRAVIASYRAERAAAGEAVVSDAVLELAAPVAPATEAVAVEVLEEVAHEGAPLLAVAPEDEAAPIGEVSPSDGVPSGEAGTSGSAAAQVGAEVDVAGEPLAPANGRTPSDGVGGDVPLAPSPSEPEGRFSSSVRVIARPLEPAASEVDVAPAVAAAAAERSGRSPTGELFARLRDDQVADDAQGAEPVVAAMPTEPAGLDGGGGAGGVAGGPAGGQAVTGDGEVAEDPFLARRRADLEELEVTLRRRLKRTMADEQNQLLEALRRQPGLADLDLLLPGEDAHVQRYADAALPSLAAAGAAGAATARWAWPDLAADGPRRRVGDLAGALAAEVVASVRRGVAEALAGGASDVEVTSEAVREAYRAVRLGPLDELADDAARAAHQRALLGALPGGVELRWVRPAGHGDNDACPVCSGAGHRTVASVDDGARVAAEGCPSLLVPAVPAHHAS